MRRSEPVVVRAKRDSTVDGDMLHLTWLGQAGFLLEAGPTSVLVDPYLSDSLAEKYRGTTYPHVRLSPPPVDAASFTDLDVVLCTHRHTDHMDPATLRELAVASTCTFVVPAAWVDHVVDLGIPRSRVTAAVEHVPFDLGRLHVHPVLAAHEELERDVQGRSLYLGYVLELNSLRLFHSGDCVPFEGQVEHLAPLEIDVALLPINGRSAERRANGVPGNFHPLEAIDLVRAIDAPVLVAHHFGMFDFNTVDEAALAEALSFLPEHVQFVRPEIGRIYEVSIGE